MKHMKKAICFIMIILIAIGACGCMENTNSSNEIIAAYNKKYDDEFTFVSSGNEPWNVNYSEVVLKSKKLNAEIVVWKYEDGSMIDNYIAIKYKNNVESLLQPIAEKIYGKCRVVNIPIHYGKEHFSSEMEFKTYVANKQSSLSVAIATNKATSSAEEDIKNFVGYLKDVNIVTNIRVFYYDVENIDDIKEVEATKIFEPSSNKRLYASVNEDFTIDSIDWSE